MYPQRATMLLASVLGIGCRADPLDTVTPSGAAVTAVDLHDPWMEPQGVAFEPALRRISHQEYRRSVQDLLGVEVPASVQLPPDAQTRGFVNQADALDVSGVLFDGYEAAAETVVTALLRRPTENVLVDAPLTAPTVFPPASARIYGGSITIPDLGRYRIDFDIVGTGPADSKDFTLSLWADEVSATSRLQSVTHVSQRVGMEVDLGPGAHGIALEAFAPLTSDAMSVVVEAVAATGPIIPVPNPAREALLSCDLDGAPASCVEEILGRLAPKALRRPLRAGELERLLTVPDRLLSEGGSPDDALGAGLRLLLIHPEFLHHVVPDRGGPVRPLDGWELAARLSALMWASLPDDELRGLAESGALLDPEVRRAQVRRMMADPRSSALAEVFLTDWLDLDRLDGASPDPSVYPGFNESIREAMGQELGALASSLVGTGRSMDALLTSNVGVVTPPLAVWYGLPEGTDGLVDLTTVGRGGLLGTAGVLMMTSNPNRSSPTRRGKFVLDKLLCSPPSPPPAGVPPLPASGDPRDLLEAHASDPFCASCHAAIDPLGFALEAFDGAGARRGSVPTTQATLADGTVIDGLSGLSQYVVDDPRYMSCVAQSLFTWAMGRGVTEDTQVVATMADAMRTGGGSLDAGIEALVTSDTFAQHRWAR